MVLLSSRITPLGVPMPHPHSVQGLTPLSVLCHPFGIGASQYTPHTFSPMQKSFPLFRQKQFYFIERDGCAWTTINTEFCNLIILVSYP